jgi:hypothetical protein
MEEYERRLECIGSARGGNIEARARINLVDSRLLHVKSHGTSTKAERLQRKLQCVVMCWLKQIELAVHLEVYISQERSTRFLPLLISPEKKSDCFPTRSAP